MFLKSQRPFLLRVSWICLVYNLLVCAVLVSIMGLDLLGIADVVLLCAVNLAAIVATILAYRKLAWMHALGPLIMLTQFCACLQTRLFTELNEK